MIEIIENYQLLRGSTVWNHILLTEVFLNKKTSRSFVKENLVRSMLTVFSVKSDCSSKWVTLTCVETTYGCDFDLKMLPRKFCALSQCFFNKLSGSGVIKEFLRGVGCLPPIYLRRIKTIAIWYELVWE